MLSDGTSLTVSAGARFEILGHLGGRMREVTAPELEAGDEIVLLQEDARVLFSERLLDAIDSGPLRQLADERSLWLTIVKAIYNEKALGIWRTSRGVWPSGNNPWTTGQSVPG